jgi:hypothetical protein
MRHGSLREALVVWFRNADPWRAGIAGTGLTVCAAVLFQLAAAAPAAALVLKTTRIATARHLFVGVATETEVLRDEETIVDEPAIAGADAGTARARIETTRGDFFETDFGGGGQAEARINVTDRAVSGDPEARVVYTSAVVDARAVSTPLDDGAPQFQSVVEERFEGVGALGDRVLFSFDLMNAGFEVWDDTPDGLPAGVLGGISVVLQYRVYLDDEIRLFTRADWFGGRNNDAGAFLQTQWTEDAVDNRGDPVDVALVPLPETTALGDTPRLFEFEPVGARLLDLGEITRPAASGAAFSGAFEVRTVLSAQIGFSPLLFDVGARATIGDPNEIGTLGSGVVAVAPASGVVPLPAAGWLLLGLGALGALRRRAA